MNFQKPNSTDSADTSSTSIPATLFWSYLALLAFFLNTAVARLFSTASYQEIAQSTFFILGFVINPLIHLMFRNRICEPGPARPPILLQKIVHTAFALFILAVLFVLFVMDKLN